MTPPAVNSPRGRAGEAGRRWLWVAGLAIPAWIAWRYAPVGGWIETATAFVRGLGRLGPPSAVGLYAIGCVAVVPGGAMTLAAGYVFGPWVGAAVAWSGALLGSLLAFGLSRAIGRRRLRRFVGRGDRLGRLDRAVARRGDWAVLLLRLNPAVPFNLASYGLGLTSVRPGPYLRGTALGMLPGTLLYAFLGSSFGPQGRLGSLGPWAWGAVAAALLLTTLALGRIARGALAEPEDRP